MIGEIIELVAELLTPLEPDRSAAEMLSPSSMLMAASPRRGSRDEITVESYSPNLAGCKRQTRWQVSPPEQAVLDAAYDRDPFPPSEIRSALPLTIDPLTFSIRRPHHTSLLRTFHSHHPPMTRISRIPYLSPAQARSGSAAERLAPPDPGVVPEPAPARAQAQQRARAARRITRSEEARRTAGQRRTAGSMRARLPRRLANPPRRLHGRDARPLAG